MRVSPDPSRVTRAERLVRASFLALVPLSAARPEPLPQGAPAAPDGGAAFGREVYPILRDHCLDCHGPEKHRGGLRLDGREAALRGGNGGAVIVPGDAAGSELLRRVSLPPEDEDVMPARGEPLRAEQVELLRRWIEGGAPWPDEVTPPPHWAYRRPERPPVPTPRASDWPRNAVDAFVLEKLEREGLAPAPEAEPAALARRLYLDLIGLPPTPEEVDAYVADPDPRAYEHLVERLLASPQFGVRWARTWLDCARYADSHGFQADDLRDLWAWRDWVVDAINADMPFDRFTIEQLAGDLLPDATPSQLIATGFNRGAPCNVELGTDPAETRANQVIDRVNTLGTVWLGSTLECAQCHDHKYDPFTTRDYYRLLAFFDRTAIEAELNNPDAPGSIHFVGPYLELPDPEVDAARAEVAPREAEVGRLLAARREELARPDPAREAEVLAAAEGAPRAHPLHIEQLGSLGGAAWEGLPDGSARLSGEVPDRDTYTVTVTTDLRDIRGFQLEALTDPSLPGNGPGRANARKPAFQLNVFEVDAAPADAPGSFAPVALAGAYADHSQPKGDVTHAIDGDPKSSWGIGPRFHRSHWAVFTTAESIGFESGTRLRFRLVQDAGGGRTIGRLRLSALTAPPGAEALPSSAPVPVEVVEALRTPVPERDAAQRLRLLAYWMGTDPTHAELLEREAKLRGELEALHPPTTLVMRENTPRETHVFLRGDFRNPGEVVEPGVPALFPPLQPRERPVAVEAGAATRGDDGLPPAPRADRLDLARWLVSPENPLVARVTVNRWWSELFGHGLVTTPEDFGVRGDPPTHPELLDWLAVELQARGWSRKDLLRTLVLSATYRQSARIPAELRERDDANLLYARGPRARMDAEMVRDNALAIAGLLNPALGGPPIRPPQPPGLWTKVGGELYEYEVSPGAEAYRRGLYVVWKRSAPYPSFVTFDAGPRTTCLVRRSRSNTPLQALTLMNDPVYVEAATALARRVLAEEPGASVERRIERAFRLALAREPNDEERALLGELFRKQLAAQDPKRSRVFAAAHDGPAGLDPGEYTAWYAVAATLLNLDETITK